MRILDKDSDADNDVPELTAGADSDHSTHMTPEPEMYTPVPPGK